MQSQVLNAPRHLHPAEAALLNSLPVSFRLPQDLRAGLSLIGLLSVPLQLMWVYAQVMNWAEYGFLGASAQGMERFQRELIAKDRASFVTPSMFQHRLLTLRGDLGEFQVAADPAVRVGVAGPGLVYQVWDQNQSFDDSVLLHPQLEPYTVHVKPKRQAKTQAREVKVMCLLPEGARLLEFQGPVEVQQLATHLGVEARPVTDLQQQQRLPVEAVIETDSALDF